MCAANCRLQRYTRKASDLLQRSHVVLRTLYEVFGGYLRFFVLTHLPSLTALQIRMCLITLIEGSVSSFPWDSGFSRVLQEND